MGSQIQNSVHWRLNKSSIESSNKGFPDGRCNAQMEEIKIWSVEEPFEEEMATHSNILA